MFVSTFATGLLLIAIPLELRGLHANPGQIGIALSMFGLGMFIFEWVWGVLADRIGYRIPMIASLILYAGGIVLLALHAGEQSVGVWTCLGHGAKFRRIYTALTRIRMIFTDSLRSHSHTSRMAIVRILSVVYLFTAILYVVLEAFDVWAGFEPLE